MAAALPAARRGRRHSSAPAPASPPLLLLVLLLAGACRSAALYHTSSEVLHWFSHCAAKRPDTMRFRELHERSTDTRMPVATITTGLQASARSKPVVMFVFGEHAREVITSEVGVWLARMLVDPASSVYDWPELAAALERAGVDADGRSLAAAGNATRGGSSGTNATSGGGSGGSGTTNTSSANVAAGASNVTSSSGAATAGNGTAAGGGGGRDWAGVARGWVQQLLGVLEVVIVPIEALDSRRQVEAGQLCVRKTAANVDLNRNWPFAWKPEAADDEQYGGPSPLSEPQSKLMKHLFDHLSGRLLGYVNVHSGEWALYTPWDSKEAYGPGLPADLPDLVSKVGRLCNCKAGPAGAVSGYLAHGTSMDYLYVHKRVPYPLTVEVFGGGDVGRLGPGEANKALDAWPVVTSGGAATKAAAAFDRRRRRRLQQQRRREGEGGGSGGSGSSSSSSGGLAAWLRRALLQEAAPPSKQQQLPQAGGEQQQQQQQGPQRAGRRRQQQQRRHKRRRRQRSQLQQDGAAGPPAAAPLPAAGAAGQPAPAAAAAAASAFSAGGRLDELRQQAAQQQQQQQRAPGGGAAAAAGGLPDAVALAAGQARPPQLQLQSADAILATAAAAQPQVRGCFDAFNPTSEADYRRVVADWLAASLLMLKHMADSPDGRKMAAHAAAAASLRGGGGALGGAGPGGGLLRGGGSRGVGVRDVAPTGGGGNATAAARGLLAGHC